jgi:hypothetical protein
MRAVSQRERSCRHHAKRVVLEGAVDQCHVEWPARRRVRGQAFGQLWRETAERALPPDDIDSLVPGDLIQPARGVPGDSREGPVPERLRQGVLDHVLGEVDVVDAEDPGER